MAQDNTRLLRLFRILSILNAGAAFNAAGLAQRLGVVERTVYRDLDVLATLGIRIDYDQEVEGYRLGRDSFLPPLHLTGSEALALLLLTKTASRGAGDRPDEQIAQTSEALRAIEKIRARLPNAVRSELEELDGAVEVRLPATGPEGGAIREVFALVRWAIANRRALHCQYDSLNPKTDDGEGFELRPYALSFDQRAWYVVGHHGGRDEVRRLKLNRFTAIKETDRPYAIPDDFCLDALRGQAWRMIRGDRLYNVAVQFDAEVAETVADTNWHRTQQVEESDDGSIVFRCEVEGLDEIVWWVLGYGPHAVVLEPAELAERVRALAQATAERYQYRNQTR